MSYVWPYVHDMYVVLALAPTEPETTTNAPKVVGKGTVPLEVLIPLILVPLIFTPLGMFFGFICYRRCRIIRNKRKRYWEKCIELAESYSRSINKIDNFLQERRGSRDDTESTFATCQQRY